MRQSSQVRETTETKIKLSLQLDESTNVSVQTGVGFFDHMLTLFARHGRFGLQVEAEGDVFVDAHHTVEDVGIVLGTCLKEALQNKEGINRYGSAYVPMDESLGFVAIDISGRSYIVFQGELTNPKLGDFDTELTEEFLEQLPMLQILRYMLAFYTEAIHITKLKLYLKHLVERLERQSIKMPTLLV